MDVNKEGISIAVRNAAGKVVMECVIETKASMILEFVDGLRGDVLVTFEEGTWAAWLYDLLNCRKSEKSESWVIRNLDSFCAASQISRPE